MGPSAARRWSLPQRLRPCCSPSATSASAGTGGDKGAATAALASTLAGPIALLGDIAYPDGSQANYDACFWPSWRPLRDRVKAVIGNHDDRNRSVFFTNWPAAGTSSKPWYSYRVGAWTVLVVEGNCTKISCSATSAQTTWLKSKLAGTTRCTALAIHQPRFSSDDEHGDAVTVDPIWRAAYSGGIDLVIAGHAHDYERIGPVGPKGNLNAAGPTLLVVGTGGTALRGFAAITPASQVRIDDTFGLVRLELRSGSWSSEFLAAPSGEVRDTAAGDCR